MSTFIINLNDTIAMSDSAIVELAKVVSKSESSVQEAATTGEDFAIVCVVCFAIVVVALIAKWAVWSWKRAEIKAAEDERIAKEEKEKAESERKQRSDAQAKLLDFLKEKVASYDMQKKEFEKACEEYKDFLEQAIKNRQEVKSQEDEAGIQLGIEQAELKAFLETKMKLFLRKDEKYQEACKEYETELKKFKQIIGSDEKQGDNGTE